MAQTDIDVCNLAIDMVGGEPIESLSEDTPLADFCGRNYGAKKDLLLGLHRWVFNTSFAGLARLATAPAGCPMANCFALPGDLLGAVHAFRDGPRIDACNVRVLVSDLGVASDAGAVWAEYSARLAEASWPAYFTNLVAKAFAADIAGRRPNASLAASLRAEAFGDPAQGGEGGLFAQARNADSRNAPERALFYDSAGPLVEARRGNWSNPFGYGVITVVQG